ncbi:uncharacterized protein LOC117332118 [Pecten maximus]|uniref:uncharacterized protein LOC117332118 n=1 Tax=Pecten maximus TaxID=6579 RepID=UPI0014584984|nr:uncharacterized protein LOC117332118 [Pecten maximus]
MRSLAPIVKRKPLKSKKVTQDVMEFVEFKKKCKPSIYAREIREELLVNNICTNDNVPSVSTVNRVVKNDLGMSYKKLTKIPQETERVNHDDLVVRYLAKMMEFTPQQMHFFHESSVLTTSGNRAYGHSDFGTRAIETQKFASNSTLTVNVCCGFFGINYYNILNGASNAMEMVNFFDEALEERNELGNPMFARGDVIVMDNCGFHHQHQGERILRHLLDQHGVTLVFQPPYSPQYNVTECVFQIMKRRLQYNSAMVENFLELAIVDALDFPASFMSGFFRQCGYV